VFTKDGTPAHFVTVLPDPNGEVKASMSTKREVSPHAKYLGEKQQEIIEIGSMAESGATRVFKDMPIQHLKMTDELKAQAQEAAHKVVSDMLNDGVNPANLWRSSLILICSTA